MEDVCPKCGDTLFMCWPMDDEPHYYQYCRYCFWLDPNKFNEWDIGQRFNKLRERVQELETGEARHVPEGCATDAGGTLERMGTCLGEPAVERFREVVGAAIAE